MIRRHAALLWRLFGALAMVATASSVVAQTIVPANAPVNGTGFFPRFDFHLGADHLSNPDPRFVWDTNFGGDMDFVDYGRGRTTFLANYEAVLGNQLRRFDPNQGDYTLELSSSLRAHGFEIAALLHHTSRHLSDRFKVTPDDWNMLGVSVATDMNRRSVQVHLQGEALDHAAEVVRRLRLGNGRKRPGHCAASLANRPVLLGRRPHRRRGRQPRSRHAARRASRGWREVQRPGRCGRAPRCRRTADRRLPARNHP